MAIYLHKLLNGDVVELRIRRHSATRKISMIFYGSAIRLTVPRLLPTSKINGFLREHNQWIEVQSNKEKNHLVSAKLQLPSELDVATLFPYLGEMVAFETKSDLVSRLDFSDGNLTLFSPVAHLEDPWRIGVELMELLQQHLIEILKPLICKWADYLGVTYTGVQLSHAKKRWGCCTSKGKLRFNWRLIFAPRFVIEAIVIHEVCHLVELNHGAAFKSLEQKCNPRVIESDQWLREQGWAVLTFEVCKNRSIT